MNMLLNTLKSVFVAFVLIGAMPAFAQDFCPATGTADYAPYMRRVADFVQKAEPMARTTGVRSTDPAQLTRLRADAYALLNEGQVAIACTKGDSHTIGIVSSAIDVLLVFAVIPLNRVHNEMIAANQNPPKF